MIANGIQMNEKVRIQNRELIQTVEPLNLEKER